MRITYGNLVLYDPVSDPFLVDVELECSMRESAKLRFKMPPTHPHIKDIAILDNSSEIECWDAGTCLMKGRVLSTEIADEVGTMSVYAEGDLSYLNDVCIRPYSTVPTEGMLVAPPQPGNYFEWLIAQYNDMADKTFEIGINQGYLLEDEYFLRSDSTYPSIGSTLLDKLLEPLGAFIRVRYDKQRRLVDLLASVESVSEQRIEFGSNLLDFTRKLDGKDVFTSVVPLGEKNENSELALTIESLPNEYVNNGAYVKDGKAVYSMALNRIYGYIEKKIEYEDITLPENLLKRAIEALSSQSGLAESLSITSYDLSQIDPSVDVISLGDWVRITSKPNGYDEHMLVTRVVYRPTNKEGTHYTFGLEDEGLPARLARQKAELDSGINRAYETATTASTKAEQAEETASSVDAKAEEAKQEAQEAATAASTAVFEANVASGKADDAKTAADEAKQEATDATEAAAEAAKVATGYIEENTEAGYIDVGHKDTLGNWDGSRVRISGNGVELLDEAGTTTDRFASGLVELGKNRSDSVVQLCSDNAQVWYDDTFGAHFGSTGNVGLIAGKGQGAVGDSRAYLGLEHFPDIGFGVVQDNSSAHVEIKGDIRINGVPLDYVVASGVTNGWTWIKYANGFAICSARFQEFVSCTIAWGNGWYRSDFLGDRTFPFPFVEIPAFSRELHPEVFPSDGMAIYPYSNPSKTSTGLAFFGRNGQSPQTGIGRVSILCIGWWK